MKKITTFIRRLIDAVVMQSITSPKSIIVGVKYVLKQDNYNPFKREVAVRVKDCQDGWVLYSMLPPGPFFQNESMTVKDFLAIYDTA